MYALPVIVLPLLIGWCILALLGVPDSRAPWRRAMQLAAGFGIGLGLTSTAFLAWVATCGPSRPLTLAAECAAVLALAAALAWRRRPSGRSDGSGSPDRSDAPPAPQRTLVALFAFTLAVGCVSAFLVALLSPHGQWDAWAIWNMRARMLVRDGGAHWADIFSPLVSHSEYPPLLPLSVARGWTVGGMETPLIPIAIQVAVLLAAALLLAAGIARRAGRWNGMLAGMFLATASWTWIFASWQYADNFVAYGLLGAVVFLHMRDTGGTRGNALAALAGFFAGFAASAKNEGLIPLGVLLAILGRRVLVGPRRKAEFRALACFVLGSLPALMPALSAKAAGAPANDLMAAWCADPSATLGRLADPLRYRILLDGLRALLLRPWEIALAASIVVMLALRALRPSRALAAPAAALAATALAYLLVLLLTPHDLAWHVRTTIDRLFSHLVPAGLFVLFSLLPDAEEAWRTIARRAVRPAP